MLLHLIHPLFQRGFKPPLQKEVARSAGGFIHKELKFYWILFLNFLFSYPN